MLAAREHDNGWREVDDAPVFSSSTGNGARLHCAWLTRSSSRVWPRAIERVGQTSAVRGCSRGPARASVYDAHRGKPSWASFFADMESRRDQELASDDPTPRRGARRPITDFSTVVDLLSLSFCHAWTDERERSGCRVRYADDGIEVSPDPFGEPVPVRIRARRLPARRFASSARPARRVRRHAARDRRGLRSRGPTS